MRHTFPGERARTLDPSRAQIRAVRERTLDRYDRITRGVRVEVDSRVARNLLDRSPRCSRHRAAARHRFEHRPAEAFVPAGKDERGSATIELRELDRRDEAKGSHAVRQPAGVGLAGENELEVGPVSSKLGKRAEQERVILVRPASRRIEKKRLARAVVRVKQIVIDPMRDDAHAFTIETEARDRALTDKCTRDDHSVRPTSSQVVCQRAEGANVPRDEGRKIAVKNVMKGHDPRAPAVRQRHRQRIVDDR